MDNPNPRQKSEEKATATAKTPAPPPVQAQQPAADRAATDRPLRLFEDAYYQYFKSIHESARQSAEGHQNAYRDYAQATQGIYEDGHRRLEEAARDYLRELQSAQQSDNPAEASQKAYNTYVLAQQTAFGPDEYNKLSEAHNSYRQAVTGLLQTNSADDDAQEAFRNYVLAIKRAWSQVDPKSLDAYSLIAIAGSILAVTSRACKH